MLTIQLLPFPVLETQRCMLRQYADTDAAGILELKQNEMVMKFLDVEKMQSLDEAHAFLKKVDELLQSNNGITWAICLKEETKFIGSIGLWRMIKEHHRAEIGYMLHPAYWNKGLMNEALKEVLRFGFEELKLHSIEANVNPANLSSIRLLQKNGFVQEAYFKENFYFRGQFLDSAIFSLVAPKTLQTDFLK